MPITASTSSTGARSTVASGNSSNENRTKPYAPILMITPASTTEPAVGASVCTSGNHVWNGNSGALIANAAMNPRKSATSTAGSSPWKAQSERIR